MTTNPIHAAFIVCGTNVRFAGTTRVGEPWDDGDMFANRLSFPGGKLEAGEDARTAAIREATEEGYAMEGVADEPFHEDIVEGKRVVWFAARSARILSDYKEKGRITPIIGPVEIFHGYGNEEAASKFLATYVNKT
jgi:hypothetical protein